MIYSNKLFSYFLCFTLFFSCVASSNQLPAGGAELGDFAKHIMGLGAAGIVINVLKEQGETGKAAASIFGVYVVLSELEKQNKGFFNGTIDIVRVPTRRLCRYYEFIRYGGESLSWNKLILWRARIMKSLSPLTKQTTVVDLSREKRLRLIDQDDNEEAMLDDHWQEYATHIQTQCNFIIKCLNAHLKYYRYHKTTINKNNAEYYEEIAFYLEELKTYLEEIVTYTQNVKQISSLDKDRVKRMMSSTCDAFEHVATLVDPNTASAGRDAVGQLTVQRENSGNSYTNPYGSPYPNY